MKLRLSLLLPALGLAAGFALGLGSGATLSPPTAAYAQASTTVTGQFPEMVDITSGANKHINVWDPNGGTVDQGDMIRIFDPGANRWWKANSWGGIEASAADEDSASWFYVVFEDSSMQPGTTIRISLYPSSVLKYEAGWYVAKEGGTDIRWQAAVIDKRCMIRGVCASGTSTSVECQGHETTCEERRGGGKLLYLHCVAHDKYGKVIDESYNYCGV